MGDIYVPQAKYSLRVGILFNSYAFGQVPGLVHIQSSDRCDVVSQHLERDDGYYRAEHPGCFGYPQDVVGHVTY